MNTPLKLPTSIGGFPEFLPAQQRAADAITARIKTVYESFGYTPLETAVVEKIDTLLAKGIDAKEVYGLRRLNAEDGEGDKDLALRFDLTVPLARYVVQNQNDLVFPFRRYQIQPVWRGERQQKGRYRQFHQCDIDMLGDGTLPLAADAEILACAITTLAAILPKGTDFTLRINNRKLLQGTLMDKGAQNLSAAIKVIDDAEKVGWRVTEENLVTKAGMSTDNARKTVEFLRLDMFQMETWAKGDVPGPLAQEGARELEQVVTLALNLLPQNLHKHLKYDLTIARGLDYYTGTVVETRLHAAPELGSICSGGRYENLTSSLGKKQIPGVGVSIGLTRLLTWLLTQEPYASTPASPATILVACQDEALRGNYAAFAQSMRNDGHNVEVHPGGQALGTQLKNAAKRGITYALIANVDDIALRQVQLKNLTTGEQTTVALDDLPNHLK